MALTTTPSPSRPLRHLPGLSGVIAIAAGTYHTVALKSDGTVVAWGLNASGQTSVPAGLSGVSAIEEIVATGGTSLRYDTTSGSSSSTGRRRRRPAPATP